MLNEGTELHSNVQWQTLLIEASRKGFDGERGTHGLVDSLLHCMKNARKSAHSLSDLHTRRFSAITFQGKHFTQKQELYVVVRLQASLILNLKIPLVADRCWSSNPVEWILLFGRFELYSRLVGTVMLLLLLLLFSKLWKKNWGLVEKTS